MRGGGAEREGRRGELDLLQRTDAKTSRRARSFFLSRRLLPTVAARVEFSLLASQLRRQLRKFIQKKKKDKKPITRDYKTSLVLSLSSSVLRLLRPTPPKLSTSSLSTLLPLLRSIPTTSIERIQTLPVSLQSRSSLTDDRFGSVEQSSVIHHQLHIPVEEVRRVGRVGAKTFLDGREGTRLLDDSRVVGDAESDDVDLKERERERRTKVGSCSFERREEKTKAKRSRTHRIPEPLASRPPHDLSQKGVELLLLVGNQSLRHRLRPLFLHKLPLDGVGPFDQWPAHVELSTAGDDREREVVSTSEKSERENERRGERTNLSNINFMSYANSPQVRYRPFEIFLSAVSRLMGFLISS